MSSGGTLFAVIANNDVVNFMKQTSIKTIVNPRYIVFIFWNGTRVEVYYSSTRLCLADAWPVSGRCLASIFQLLPNS